MKTIINYGITYDQSGTHYDECYFSKINLMKRYFDILDSREISSLKLYQWEGKRKAEYKDITADVNKFLSR